MTSDGSSLITVYREALSSRHYARRTIATYERWLRRYLTFHQLRHPREIWQMFALALLAAAGVTAGAGVLWILWVLVTSPSEPDGFGQVHQEQWAVASCWRQSRDGQITSTSQCSEYAQDHLDFFTEQLAPKLQPPPAI